MEQLQDVAGAGHPQVGVHVDLVDAAAGHVHQLGHLDAEGVHQVAAQGVDGLHILLRHRGGTVAHQIALDALVQHALLGGDGDLPPDAGVLALVGTVAGAVADGQRVAAGLFEEVHRLHGVGVGGGGAEHMVLHARQHAQFAFHRNAVGVGVLDHLAGQFHVVLIGQAAAVDHDAGVAARDAGFDALQRFAVVQVQRHRDGAVRTIPLDGVAQHFRALLLFLDGAVHEIRRPAQVRVGGFRPLQDGR